MILVKAPQYNRGFVIVQESIDIPYAENFHYFFYAYNMSSREGKPGDYCIGQLFGHPFEDKDFKKKLARWVGIMNIAYGSDWYHSVSRGNPKELQRLSTEKKRNRALSRLYNAHMSNLQSIKNSGSLYINEEIQKAQLEYEATIEKVKKKYNESEK